LVYTLIRNQHEQEAKKEAAKKREDLGAEPASTVKEGINLKNPTENSGIGGKKSDREKDHHIGPLETIVAALTRSSLTDWLLALFTLVLAGAAIYQFVIMGGQLDTMRKDQRAWIVVTQKSGTTIAIDAAPSTSMTITNTGKTPASQIVGHFYVEVVPNGENPHFEAQMIHTTMISGVVLPNAPQEITASRRRAKVNGTAGEGEGDPLTPDEKASLDAGKSWIAVHGIVWYDDVFHQHRHWIKFCFWSDLKPGNYGSRGCTAYNSIDDD
jgi:hypothetical protein